MRAVRVEGCGGPEVLHFGDTDYWQKPNTVSSGELLVKNYYSGVNFIDTYHRSGLYPLPLPFTPGREGSGVVELAGEGTNFKVGDRVAYFAAGSYAEYTVVPADRTVKLPDGVSFETGAACLLQGLTALMLAREIYTVGQKDIVLIHAAAGGVGQLLCQICKAAGATVIGTTSTAAKAELAKRAGADHVILYTQQNVVDAVKTLTNNQMCNVVFDGVGQSTFESSLASLKRRGWLLCFGNASGKPDVFDITRLTKGSLTITRPTLMDFVATKQEFEKLSGVLFNDYIATGKLKFSIGRVFDLAEAQQAHMALEGRETTGKVLLKIN